MVQFGPPFLMLPRNSKYSRNSKIFKGIDVVELLALHSDTTQFNLMLYAFLQGCAQRLPTDVRHGA